MLPCTDVFMVLKAFGKHTGKLATEEAILLAALTSGLYLIFEQILKLGLNASEGPTSFSSASPGLVWNALCIPRLGVLHGKVNEAAAISEQACG